MPKKSQNSRTEGDVCYVSIAPLFLYSYSLTRFSQKVAFPFNSFIPDVADKTKLVARHGKWKNGRRISRVCPLFALVRFQMTPRKRKREDGKRCLLDPPCRHSRQFRPGGCPCAVVPPLDETFSPLRRTRSTLFPVPPLPSPRILEHIASRIRGLSPAIVSVELFHHKTNIPPPRDCGNLAEVGGVWDNRRLGTCDRKRVIALLVD